MMLAATKKLLPAGSGRSYQSGIRQRLLSFTLTSLIVNAPVVIGLAKEIISLSVYACIVHI
jgi:hypothetical protein